MLKNKRNLIFLSIFVILATTCLILISSYNKENAKLGGNSLNIAYSTDKNYIYPTLVSMVSVMENAKKENNYKFTVLLSDGIEYSEKQKFKTLEKNYSNCSVEFVEMGERFGNSEVKFWSRAMYYRLSLPEILKGEKKCIYLDGDTIVRKDLQEMYNINMENYYIAGIRDINEIINKESEHYKVLDIPNLNSYICSGVLIMNLEKIRNDGMQKTFENLVKQNDIDKKFKFPDQDVLNKACFGHILTLPFKYGALAHTDFTKSYSESEYANWASNEKDWEEGRKDPTVIHFTGEKPWVSIYSDFCKQWWEYAEKTGFGEKIHQVYKI